MTGGGSLLYGLDRLLSEKTGIPCYVAEDAIFMWLSERVWLLIIWNTIPTAQYTIIAREIIITIINPTCMLPVIFRS